MKFLKKYVNLHFYVLLLFYQKVLISTDKSLFEKLFNLKSFFLRTKSRVKWTGSCFVVLDKRIPNFSYEFRHQRQGNMAYEKGIIERAQILSKSYFLDLIDFKKGDVFFDCGANVGDIHIWFELNNIDIDYVAFEPSPIEYQCLKNNISTAKINNLGLWRSKGTLRFYLSSQGADSSLIQPKNYDEVIEVKVDKLENLIHRKIKCFKLEAEGAEPEILEGIGNKLNMIEFITADLGYERGTLEESTFIPVTNYLLSRGFELVGVGHDRICAIYKNSNFNNH